MREQFDDFKKFINQELDDEAEQIEKAIQQIPEIAELKASDEAKKRLKEKIDEYNRQRALDSLSEEDREALLLGRKVMEDEKLDTERKVVRRRKKVWKRILAVAAVMIMVLAVSITSVGGPKRFIEKVINTFGGRETTRVNTTTGNIKATEESNEEKAYQEINEVLGFDPVKIIKVIEGLRFKQIEINKNMQTAQLLYDNSGKNISYIISCSYAEDSLGLDVEDRLIDKYDYHLNKTVAEVREYQIEESDVLEYVARFEYKEVYYQLIAITDKDKFEFLLKNLHFP